MSSNKYFFSIIIPVMEINDYIRESLPYLLAQDYQNLEIIIIPDYDNKPLPLKSNKVKILESGKIGPAEKRDMGARIAKGNILAFIDDDAYPAKEWLSSSIKAFNDKKTGAVGGPNVTPPNATYFEKISGEVLASPMVAGTATGRYKPIKKHESDDLPSVNLLVRKELFNKIGGFDSSYWPGEDTKLCLDIIKNGKKIIYQPEVLVYHHRRKNLRAHLKQIFNYAKHRGYFMKKLPGNSLKLAYFVPSLFLIGLIVGAFTVFLSKLLFTLYLTVLLLYFFLLFVFSLRTRPLMILSFMSVAFLTHITYGIGLIFGLLKTKLRSKLA